MHTNASTMHLPAKSASHHQYCERSPHRLPLYCQVLTNYCCLSTPAVVHLQSCKVIPTKPPRKMQAAASAHPTRVTLACTRCMHTQALTTCSVLPRASITETHPNTTRLCCPLPVLAAFFSGWSQFEPQLLGHSVAHTLRSSYAPAQPWKYWKVAVWL